MQPTGALQAIAADEDAKMDAERSFGEVLEEYKLTIDEEVDGIEQQRRLNRVLIVKKRRRKALGKQSAEVA